MAKRRAEKQLVRDDVDQSDEEDSAGEYSKAEEDEIAKRVFKTAKRRNPGTSTGTSPFSLFAFGSAAPSTNNALPLFQFMKKNDVSEEMKNTTSEEKINTEPRKDLESLKALNLSCVKWIQQHLDKDPFVILLPVFRDYEKHLTKLNLNTENTASLLAKVDNPTINFNFGSKPVVLSVPVVDALKPDDKKTIQTTKSANAVSSTTFPPFQFSNTGSSAFKTTSDSKPTASSIAQFSFGRSDNKLASSVSSTTFPAFQFSSNGSNAFNNGMKPAQEKTSPFSSNTLKTSSAPNALSSSSLNQNSVFTAETNDQQVKKDEPTDEPPQSNFVPVGEEGSIFDIRCKVFIKKADGFSSIGVGTLYLKDVGEKKTQLIVRADTAQGSVLLNFLLSPELPIQSTGKNNVLLVTIPTPESKPPPIPVLVRVKNGEERDKLLNELKRLSGC